MKQRKQLQLSKQSGHDGSTLSRRLTYMLLLLVTLFAGGSTAWAEDVVIGSLNASTYYNPKGNPANPINATYSVGGYFNSSSDNTSFNQEACGTSFSTGHMKLAATSNLGSKLYDSSNQKDHVFLTLSANSSLRVYFYHKESSAQSVKVNLSDYTKSSNASVDSKSLDNVASTTLSYVDFSVSSAGQYAISNNSSKSIFIVALSINGSTPTPAAAPTANFTYGQTVFPQSTTLDITVPAHKAGSSLTVNLSNITDGATASGTGLSGNTLTITAPAAGGSSQVAVTVTDNNDSSNKTVYTINVKTETKVGTTFDENTRYSKLLIEARKNDFYSNTNSGGLGYGSNLDYVPGLVAKAMIDAVDYYKDHQNAEITNELLASWYNSVKTYGSKPISTNGIDGKSFDDLNATKIFFGLKNVAASGKVTGIEAYSDANTKLASALSGIKNANTSYSISSSHANYPISIADMQGGWWHKADYINQMWGDGQYMGTALLAQLINDADVYNESTRLTSNDWNVVANQIKIYHKYAWDNTVNLPHHAFAADKGTNSVSHSDTWKMDGDTYHNEGIWGRAAGWYFMALVDVLEQMPSSHVDYNTIKGYLSAVASGIKARQDDATGCWYQLPLYDNTFSAAEYNNSAAQPGRVYNYLESSATALYTAAYLKAIRLGFLDKGTYEATAKKAYKGIIENFMSDDNNIYWCCKSAGLGGKGDTYKENGAKFRDGSNAYYLKGNDVAPTKPGSYTEGKVLGAFIMAATEYERAYLDEVIKEDITRFSPKGGTNTTKITVGQIVNPYLFISPFTSDKKNLTVDDFEITSTDNSIVTGAIRNNTIYNEIENNDCRHLVLNVTGVNPGSATITVHFKGNDEYNPYDWSCVYTVAETRTVEATNDDNGTVKITSKDAEVTSVLDGTQVTYTAIPNDGYMFAGWVDNSTEKYLPEHANDNPLTITVTANTSLKATFTEARTFNVAYATGSDATMGSIAIYERNTNTPNLNGVSVPENMNLDFVANPNNGYKFDGWYSDDACETLVSSDVKFLKKAQDIANNITYYAKFAQKESETLFNLVVSSETTEKVTADAPIAITKGSYASTLEGGTATAGTLSGSYEAVNANDYLKFGANAQYVKIDLTKPLAAGDVIEFTSYGGNNKQLTFTTDNKRATANLTSDGKYIVPAGSNLVGATTLYVWRAESSTTYVSSLKITRPAVTLDAVIKIDNIIQAKTETSGDGSSESSRETYEYEVPGDYEGATVPVAISTSGTVSEAITSLATPVYGTPTVKDFTITAGETVKYFRITLTRGMSSKSEILGATINGTAAVINENTISQVIPYGGATEVPVSLTLPEGATASPAVPFNMTLDAAAGATASQEVTVTAQDGVSKTIYTVNLTRGKNDVLMVTYDGQEYLLLKENNKTESPSTGNDYFTRGSSSSWSERTIDQVKYNLYNLSNSNGREISLVVNGAMSFEVFTTNGTSGRTYKVTVTDEDGTIAQKTITHGGSGLESTGLINAQSTKNVTIKLSNASSTVYPFKVIFYTTKKAKKDVTLEYSAAEWDGSNSQPTLTAKDEDGNTLTIGTDITVSYTTDDPNVAEVEDNGNVTIAPAANGNAVITATSAENETYNAASAHFVVKKQQGVTFALSKGDSKPEVREHIFLYDDKSSEMGENPADGKNVLLTGTFGGWNRNDHKYNPSDLTSTSSTKTDEWAAVTGAMNPVDGYEWASMVKNDAADEACNQESYYGKDRAGWFQPADVEDGKVVESYPFTLPVRGGYMTFEPTVNGTLTIYIDQNGAWDNDGGGKADFLGHFRKHAFFITDQNGVSVSNYTNFSTITKTPVTQGDEKDKKFTCNLDANGNAADEDPYNIGNWDEFKNYFTRSERIAVKDAWNTGVNGAQQVIKLDNGSFLVTQRAAVKYTFHVAAGQTYYLFSNFSKMGFCAVNFVEETETGSQPTATLALEEKVAYTAPTLNGTPGEGNHVKNISIPQYKQITLDRKFTENTWNTIYLPFVMTEKEVRDVFGDGTQLILLNNTSIAADGALEVQFIYHEIQDILAGYPYLIKPSKEVNAGEIKVTNKLLDPSAKERVFASGDYQAMGIPGYCTANVTREGSNVSTYSAKLSEGDLYVNGGKVYVASKTPVYSNGYRSYIKKINSNAPAPTAVRLMMSGIDDEEPTEITLAELSDEAAETLGINKEVNGIYNLNGQKVADSHKNLPAGLYIVNGRKMVVK
ncbi:MAG: glycoside hydrolase family 88 protein [Bacteroidaceae bacterium]|nr:glycoside hydrolase family 88 protein [Bacteroidaceae bacterium]